MTSSAGTKLRIMVADDNRRMLRALVIALSSEFEVVGTAGDGAFALDRIRTLQPAVAVLNLDMPELSGIEVTRKIKREGLACAVVICSVESDQEVIADAQEAGALGYVLQQSLARDIVTAIRRVARGESFVSGEQRCHYHWQIAK